MYIGVDIGGTRIKIGIVSRLGRIVGSSMIKTNAPRDCESIIDDIIVEINNLCEKENINIDDIEGVGVGIPGVVDPQTGIVINAANLKWKQVEFTKIFEQKLDIECRIGNDANCAALGEYNFGGGKGCNNEILITLGTGIGSGVIIDGQIFDGFKHAGGECGHMTLIYNGEQCGCGNKGCWEAYASASALVRQTQKAANEHPESQINDFINKFGGVSAKTAFDAAKLGDEIAKNVVAKYVDYVAAGLISLAQIFHPEMFILGGGVSSEGRGLIDPVKQKLNDFIDKNNYYPNIEVKKAVLENNAGIVGAACLVMGNA